MAIRIMQPVILNHEISPLPGLEAEIAAHPSFSSLTRAAVSFFLSLRFLSLVRVTDSNPRFPYLYCQQILSYLLFPPHNSLKSKTNP